MSETNPVTEEVKKTAEETGAKAENVAEGRVDKEKLEAMDKALEMGSSLIIRQLEKDGVVLTDEQKEGLKQAYGASFALSALLMK